MRKINVARLNRIEDITTGKPIEVVEAISCKPSYVAIYESEYYDKYDFHVLRCKRGITKLYDADDCGVVLGTFGVPSFSGKSIGSHRIMVWNDKYWTFALRGDTAFEQYFSGNSGTYKYYVVYEIEVSNSEVLQFN